MKRCYKLWTLFLPALGLSLILFACSNFQAPSDSESHTNETTNPVYGPVEVQQRLNECNLRGKFFDRLGNDGAGVCDETRNVPKFRCRDRQSIIKGLKLNRDEMKSFNDYVSAHFADHAFDQCVDEALTDYVYLVHFDGSTTKFGFVKIDKPK